MEQQNKRKKYGLAALIVVGVLIILLILYFVLREENGGIVPFFANLLGNDNESLGGVPSSNESSTPLVNEKREGALVQISQEAVVGGMVTPDNTAVRYFTKSQGHLYKNALMGGAEERLSNVTIPSLLDAAWTPSGEYAVLSYYTDGDMRRVHIRYSATSTFSSAFLPNDIQEITVAKNHDAIAYTVRSGETALITANPDNTAQKQLHTTPISDFELTWPTKNILGLKTKSSAFAKTYFYTFIMSSKTLTRVFGEKEGLDVLWSPDGERVLLSETANEGGNMYMSAVSLKENTVTNIPFSSFTEKCVWSRVSKDIVYCGVPEEVPPRSHMPDDWWQGVVSFSDALWKINMQTGEREQLLAPRAFDTIKLFLSKDDLFLFFTNKKDGILWSLRLP